MKKIYSLLAAVLLMVGFAACDDVDNPFPQPGQGGDQSGDSTQVIAPAGDGSLENPIVPVSFSVCFCLKMVSLQ